MRDALNRQLIAPTFAALLIFAPLQGRAESAVAERLRAAKLMQTALAARGAGPEEWRKLDETYVALIAKFSRDATARNAHAEYLWDLGEKSRALAEWEAAEQIDPANAVVLEHLGDTALELGDVRKSAAYYSRAVTCNPQSAECHFALANVWYLFRRDLVDAQHPDATGLLTGSLTHFAAASRLAPTNLEYARAYAETFYGLPDPDWKAAAAAWETFRLLSPDQDFAHLHLARVYLNMGHLDASRSYLNKVQSSGSKQLKSRLEARVNAQAEKASTRTEKFPE